MKGVIYKAVESIVAEEVLNACEFEEVPKESGDIFSYDDFCNDVNSYCLTDYDGCGGIIIEGKGVAINTETDICLKRIHIGGKLIVPWEVLYELFGDKLKILWYNK